MSEPAFAELLELAVDLAWRAGRITLGYFQAGIEASAKADGTPVTVADREAEAFLRREIRARYPEDGLYGEEYGEEPGGSSRTWVVDPIDGTESFVRGVPFYGVLIGVLVDRLPVAGVIHLPALGETVAAYRGGGCYLNGRRVRVSPVGELAQSLVTTSDMLRPGKAAHDRVAPLFTAAGLRRTWGDCYGYAMVATGRAEVMIDPEISPWDIAAVQPIIEEAGGRFSDLEGDATIWGEAAVASNGRVHGAILDLVRR